MIKPWPTLSTRFSDLVNRTHQMVTRTHDALLPELCVACLGPDADWGLCQGCRKDLPNNDRCCLRCGLPLPLMRNGQSQTCGQCLEHQPDYCQALIPWRYEFPVDRMIGRYKYQGQRQYARPLLHDMAVEAAMVLDQYPERRPELLIAAPMHRKRQRKRGFNQAAEIAEAISRQTGIPWTDRLIQRTRKARPQSGLDRRQRLTNLKGLFEIQGRVPAQVALIDDVVTTGATAGTLATLLRRHGAQRVEIWALARTPAAGGSSDQPFPDVAGDGEARRQPG